MSLPQKPRRTDYKISVRESGPYFGLFGMRWYWSVDHVGGSSYSMAGGFASSEARAVKKATRLAHKLLEHQKRYHEQRTIYVKDEQ